MNGESLQGQRLFLVAGEASGDQLGADLIRALRELSPALEVRGMGGPALAAAGMRCLVDASEVAVVGVVEVLRRLPSIRRAFKQLEREISSWRPDALVLIDFPDFNLRLAKVIRPLGVPIIYYVSPQLWAWRRGRIKVIRRTIDHMMVLFPFEEALYREAGVPVTFVGHPLVDRIEALQPRAKPGLEGRGGGSPEPPPTVALLPGSRPSEIRAMLPAMLETAARLADRLEGIRLVLAQAPTIREAELRPHLARARVPIEVVADRTLEVLRDSDAALVASGTATLEAGMLQVPMVVIYRVSWWTYLIARLLVRGVSSIGMVNLVTGRPVVPERIQWLRPGELAGLLLEQLTDRVLREAVRTRLTEVRAGLGQPGASSRAAHVVLEFLLRRAPSAGPSGPPFRRRL